MQRNISVEGFKKKFDQELHEIAGDIVEAQDYETQDSYEKAIEEALSYLIEKYKKQYKVVGYKN